MKNSNAQIVATIGPASSEYGVLKSMIEHQLDVVRLNFSWGDNKTRLQQIQLIRELEKECGRKIPIIADLPGPRIQENTSHTYNHEVISAITEHDKKHIQFAVQQSLDFIAVSFVGSANDINECRKIIHENNGTQKIIAKIERAIAVESFDDIIASADAVMVARGDLGNEVPIEQIPFVQKTIVEKAKKAGKPVIVATQMLLSMVENPVPTRAEVTDVSNAIMQGADAVMLSEETARGKYPVEAVAIMEKIILESEQHLANGSTLNHL